MKAAKSTPKFDYKSIKSFEDACAKLGIDPTQLPEVSNIPEEFQKPVLVGYKLMIIFKAINDGWVPDWSNSTQYKYYPWFWVLPSGFGSGFSGTYFSCTITNASVGSRLCTDTSDKAQYIADQFKPEYQEYFLCS